MENGRSERMILSGRMVAIFERPCGQTGDAGIWLATIRREIAVLGKMVTEYPADAAKLALIVKRYQTLETQLRT